MVWIKRAIGLVLGVLVGVLILQGVASESGEVVVLSTQGTGEAPEETRLWVVDFGGYQYLRAGQAESGWFSRLRATPRVGVERGDVRMAYDAVPEPDRQAEVNALMQAKYGWADTFIGMLFGRDDATPIRLEPVLDTMPPVPAPVAESDLVSDSAPGADSAAEITPETGAINLQE